MPDFFDKVKQGIAKSVATASVKSKELLDVAKLRNQISALEKVRRESFEELGRTVYTQYLNDSLDENIIKSKSYSITRIDEQIQSLEDDIVRVQTQARQSLNDNEKDAPGKCTCGAPVTAEMKFCGVCGQKVEIDEKQPEQAVTDCFCSQCGERLEPYAKFCSSCGEKIS